MVVVVSHSILIQELQYFLSVFWVFSLAIDRLQLELHRLIIIVPSELLVQLLCKSFINDRIFGFTTRWVRYWSGFDCFENLSIDNALSLHHLIIFGNQLLDLFVLVFHFWLVQFLLIHQWHLWILPLLLPWVMADALLPLLLVDVLAHFRSQEVALWSRMLIIVPQGWVIVLGFGWGLVDGLGMGWLLLVLIGARHLPDRERLPVLLRCCFWHML